MKKTVRFNLPSEEVYHLLFAMFSRKRKWKMVSYTEPSLIVVSTGFPILSRRSDKAGGLAKISIEPEEGETEVSFLFDFRKYYGSLIVFDLIDATLIFGGILPYSLKSHSVAGLLSMGILLLGLFAIPWFGHGDVKKAEAEVISVSKAAIKKETTLSNERENKQLISKNLLPQQKFVYGFFFALVNFNRLLVCSVCA